MAPATTGTYGVGTSVMTLGYAAVSNSLITASDTGRTMRSVTTVGESGFYGVRLGSIDLSKVTSLTREAFHAVNHSRHVPKLTIPNINGEAPIAVVVYHILEAFGQETARHRSIRFRGCIETYDCRNTRMC